jgi:hypothetical protein
MVQYELSRICNYSANYPQSEHFFLKKKRDFTTYGGKIFFSTEEKCFLMGWDEYGVKSKDIVARVGPSQRAENM